MYVEMEVSSACLSTMKAVSALQRNSSEKGKSPRGAGRLIAHILGLFQGLGFYMGNCEEVRDFRSDMMCFIFNRTIFITPWR